MSYYDLWLKENGRAIIAEAKIQELEIEINALKRIIETQKKIFEKVTSAQVTIMEEDHKQFLSSNKAEETKP